MAEAMELKIYSKEDRLKVAAILIDNGYTVSQGKRQRTPTGKTLDSGVLLHTEKRQQESKGSKAGKRHPSDKEAGYG